MGEELLIGAPKERQLPTWMRPWNPTSFAHMATSSSIGRGDRAANQSTEDARWTELLIAYDLEVTVGITSFAPMAASSHDRLLRFVAVAKPLVLYYF